jgi:hypothetical protein
MPAYRKGSRARHPHKGTDAGITGVKRGVVGLDTTNTKIENDVFSRNWNSPLNSNNRPDPMVDVPEGPSALRPGLMGLPGNPLGIGGPDFGGRDAKEGSSRGEVGWPQNRGGNVNYNRSKNKGKGR